MPNEGKEICTSANHSPLNVVSTINVPVTLGGRDIPTMFHVMKDLLTDVILVIDFFQHNSAVLDYMHKRLSLLHSN